MAPAKSAKNVVQQLDAVRSNHFLTVAYDIVGTLKNIWLHLIYKAGRLQDGILFKYANYYTTEKNAFGNNCLS